jgi:drug/metabolite transporter (DMT)-like permease
LSALLFAFATPVSKLLLTNLSSFQLAGLLYLGAAVGVAPMLVAKKRRFALRSMNRKNWYRLLGAVGFGGIAGPVFLLMGLRMASASSVALWLNLELVFTAMLGWLLFHDHLGRFGWFGIGGVLTAGVLVSAGEGMAGIAAGSLVGLACLCWGMDNHLTALIDGITPASSTFVKGTVAGSINLLIGTLSQPLTATPAEMGAGLLLGALSYGASIVLYITAAQGLGATRGQALFAAAPFFGVILSVIILGESLSVYQVAAAVVLALALVIMFRDRHAHEHEHAPVTHEHMHRHDDLHHDHKHLGVPNKAMHSHPHTHASVRHSHPHWPDLHHRHKHT